jgi:hypothetical protein
MRQGLALACHAVWMLLAQGRYGCTLWQTQVACDHATGVQSTSANVLAIIRLLVLATQFLQLLFSLYFCSFCSFVAPVPHLRCHCCLYFCTVCCRSFCSRIAAASIDYHRQLRCHQRTVVLNEAARQAPRSSLGNLRRSLAALSSMTNRALFLMVVGCCPR